MIFVLFDLILEAVIPEVKSEHNGNQQENSAVQGKNVL